MRLGYVLLKLQHLQLDFQEIAFADVAGVVAGLADVHRVLKTLHVLQREIERGFRELHADELRRHVEGEGALIVRHQRFGLRGDVLRGLQAVLAFLAALEKVGDARIELRGFVNVFRGEFTGLKNRKELRVQGEHWIRPQVRGDFQRLVLLNGGARRFQIVVVLRAPFEWPDPWRCARRRAPGPKGYFAALLPEQGSAGRKVAKSARRQSLRNTPRVREWRIARF